MTVCKYYNGRLNLRTRRWRGCKIRAGKWFRPLGSRLNPTLSGNRNKEDISENPRRQFACTLCTPTYWYEAAGSPVVAFREPWSSPPPPSAALVRPRRPARRPWWPRCAETSPGGACQSNATLWNSQTPTPLRNQQERGAHLLLDVSNRRLWMRFATVCARTHTHTQFKSVPSDMECRTVYAQLWEKKEDSDFATFTVIWVKWIWTDINSINCWQNSHISNPNTWISMCRGGSQNVVWVPQVVRGLPLVAQDEMVQIHHDTKLFYFGFFNPYLLSTVWLYFFYDYFF